MHDQTLTCRDCGQAFTFTIGEREVFAGRGFDNVPGRCPACRTARKPSDLFWLWPGGASAVPAAR